LDYDLSDIVVQNWSFGLNSLSRSVQLAGAQ
jgi:hypothetical protein